MSDDPKRENDDNPKPKPVKRPAKPRNAWLVPRGIAWAELDGREVRHGALTELPDGIIPDHLIAEYAERGDIIRLTQAGSD